MDTTELYNYTITQYSVN